MTKVQPAKNGPSSSPHVSIIQGDEESFAAWLHRLKVYTIETHESNSVPSIATGDRLNEANNSY